MELLITIIAVLVTIVVLGQQNLRLQRQYKELKEQTNLRLKNLENTVSSVSRKITTERMGTYSSDYSVSAPDANQLTDLEFGSSSTPWGLESTTEENRPAREINPPFMEEVQRLIPKNKIQAIKVYRQYTGVGLKEAKDAVESLERKQKR